MNRKQFLAVTLAAPLVPWMRLRAAGPLVNVYKDPTCGCCGLWAEHLKKNGFEVKVQEVSDTSEYKRKFGVPASVGSCHTAMVDGYAIEGHVPAAEIQRLLKERPKVKGLAVAGMPMGSPGMEGSRSDPYTVVAFDAAGKVTPYQSYPRK